MNTKFDFDTHEDQRIVYVRPVKVADLPEDLREQAAGIETLYAVHTYLRRNPAVWRHPRFQDLLERMQLDDASLREQGFPVEAP